MVNPTESEYQFAIKVLNMTLQDIELSKEKQLELVKQLSNERLQFESLLRRKTHCENVISKYENGDN